MEDSVLLKIPEASTKLAFFPKCLLNFTRQDKMDPAASLWENFKLYDKCVSVYIPKNFIILCKL